MSYTLSALALIVAGHFFCATLVYLNHRFVFHTRLGNLPLLKGIKKLHSLHHAHAYNENRNEYIYVPLKWRVALTLTILFIGVFNHWFAIGIASFAMLYTYRHHAIIVDKLD